MRDKNMSESYFNTFIECQKKSIEKFEKIKKSLPESNVAGHIRASSYLCICYWKVCVALYSVGAPIKNIKKNLQKCVKIIEETATPELLTNELFYDIVSLSYLICEESELEVLRRYAKLIANDDSIIQLLLFKNEQAFFEGHTFLNSVVSDLLNNILSENRIDSSLSEKWLHSKKNFFWYDSLKRKDEFFGYWAFDVAAVFKYFNLVLPSNIDYIPNEVDNQ